MVTLRYGGKKGRSFRLTESEDHVAVRTHSKRSVGLAALSAGARSALDDLEPVFRLPEAGVEVMRVRAPERRRAVRDRARGVLKAEPEVRFAGRVLKVPGTTIPVLYTENLFVKFDAKRAASGCKRLLSQHGLAVVRELPYARNAYFVSAPEGIGTEVFDLAEKLLAEPSVELAHPETVRQVRRLAAFPRQWHLQKAKIGEVDVDAHVNVVEAWKLTQGEGITIAVIDDGVDLDHEEFASAGKIVAPRDVTLRTDDPRPGPGDNHGTACAGVACGDGLHGASGVAPRARLLPIRLASGLGSQAEADAFVWAAQHGADVISCSWGPVDGRWWDASDPTHQAVVPLPDSTRLAIDFALEEGRGGKGCVICWAAGNGNESVDNDGYASNQKVIAVAASNDVGKKSVYSDFGDAIWCAFPSSDFAPGSTRTTGIWTTDRTGRDGYNPGQESKGDSSGNYTNSFGGTSSACPGIAGVAALVLARNPSLSWHEVKDVVKRACRPIDSAGGSYDAGGHSASYGFGCPDAAAAVRLAAPVTAGYTAIHTAVQAVPVKDQKKATLKVAVGDTAPVQAVKVSVKIEHPSIGDLVVRVLPPPDTGVSAVTLHDREGGDLDNLDRTFDGVTTPALAALAGKSPQGTWTLEVRGKASENEGQILSFGVELQL
jgi:subtilisin family serine protease